MLSEPIKFRTCQNFGDGLQRYNWPEDWARALIKSSMDSATLLVSIKKIFDLGVVFSLGDVKKWAGF